MLGVWEISTRWCFEAVHVLGSENIMTDGVSRWPRRKNSVNLAALSPSVRWQEASLGATGGTACLEILQSCCQRLALLYRLTQLIPRLGRCG